MDPNKRYFTYFEYMAAKLYFEDVKLHLLCDQADSGIYLETGEWETGVKNPVDQLNFTQLWDALDPDRKEFYLNMARRDLYSENEINKR